MEYAIFIITLACSITISYTQGQSGFYFGQSDNRFVPGFSTIGSQNQGQGSFFEQNGFGNQFRTSNPEYQQTQLFGSQPGPQFSRFQGGRSQASGQFYLNQPDFAPLQQSNPGTSFSNRIPPTSFQFSHPASTTRPDYPRFAPTSHNHDPSKPEQFLGQITINNPDPFPNNPGDIHKYNSIRIRPASQSGFGSPNVLRSPALDGDLDSGFPKSPELVNQDLYDYTEKPKPTTYNPSKSEYASKIKPNINKVNSRPSYFESEKEKEQKKPVSQISDNYYGSDENSFSSQRNRFKPKTVTTTTPHPQTERKNRFSPSTKPVTRPPNYNPRNSNRQGFVPSKQSSTTEYKPLFDLEPLLEDEIPDLNSFGDSLKSSSNGSEDVEVIKSADVTNSKSPSTTKQTPTTRTVEKYIKQKLEKAPTTPSPVEEATEYYDEEIEYVDDAEDDSAHHDGDNEDHNGEEIEYEEVADDGEELTTVAGETFDVLTMKPKPPMVKDDNFKGFVDSALIDSTEPPTYVTEEVVDPSETESNTTDPPAVLLGQEVVSVVTTKSVVNGTYSVPEYTKSPASSTSRMTTPSPEETTAGDKSKSTATPNSTESWIVVASVQTSRSISGARFLPFPGVAQNEKKQVSFEEEEGEGDEETKQNTTTDKPEYDEVASTQEYSETTSKSSTESIIDKLDRVQSELSSGILSGGFKGDQDFDVLTEMNSENSTNKDENTSVTTPLQIFTVRSTPPTSTTERATPEPLPVTIKKFSSFSRPTTTTTSKPKAKIAVDDIKMDDLAGLLPPEFKYRPSFKDRKITTTTEKTVPTIVSTTEAVRKYTPKSKFVTVPEDVSAFLPKGYKPPKSSNSNSQDDLSKLLPPGYKPPSDDSVPPIKIETVDISAFLPKDFKLKPTTTTEKSPGGVLANAKPVDISAFLPPGFKLDSKDTKEEKVNASSPIIPGIKFADVSSLLPPGFKPETIEKTPLPETTTKASSGGFKVVFPSRPGGGKAGKRLTTPKPGNEDGKMTSGGVAVPTIQKGWPVRATTEFTGWPTPSTTPFSIEKLLEAQRAATAQSAINETQSTTTSTTTTSTTPSTTTTTAVPTTPGVCGSECDLAATIKIVGGVQWVPELLDHNTKEWQLLANEVSRELDATYSKSPLLKKWYKGIRIDAFSKGSVLVDYFVELNDVVDKLDTIELKKLFHKSLNEAPVGSLVEEVPITDAEQLEKLTGRKIDGFDPDMMLGDQPPEEREKVKRIDKSKGMLEIGKFILDPVYTEFIVLPKRIDPTVGFAGENPFFPQWGIAVIVITLASLLFVIIFGVTVLVNRQKNTKAKQPIPLSEDMLRELDKSHMGGADDLFMHDHDPPYQSRTKRISNAMMDSTPYPGNPGDSWRSEWGPYYSQYHGQHYTPDSGHGSQSYHGGNYGYSGSQTYGYNGHGQHHGSYQYGYGGEGVHTLYPSRRADYDSNF